MAELQPYGGPVSDSFNWHSASLMPMKGQAVTQQDKHGVECVQNP